MKNSLLSLPFLKGLFVILAFLSAFTRIAPADNIGTSAVPYTSNAPAPSRYPLIVRGPFLFTVHSGNQIWVYFAKSGHSAGPIGEFLPPKSGSFADRGLKVWEPSRLIFSNNDPSSFAYDQKVLREGDSSTTMCFMSYYAHKGASAYIALPPQVSGIHQVQ